MPNCIALVVAAGRGTRLGGELPKQYLTLAGKPLLRHSLETLKTHPGIAGVRVVFNPADQDLYDKASAGLDLLSPVAGGAARQDSVRLGLESLSDLKPDRVLVHDGARPFLDRGTIDRVLGALDETPAAIPALQIVDTVKRDKNGVVAETIDRAHLWRVQTPQGFHYEAILAAHRAGKGLDLPDDAAVAERAKLAVKVVEGSADNVKVTTPDDLERARRFFALQASESRTGQGFDVHPFGPGDHIWLCGVKVPHSHGLVGHSDADAGLHALTDAILGTIGAGDIGMHFPPSDPRWRGAASDKFLRHAVDIARAQGGVLVHVDITVICESPKVGPHRATMVARLSEILGLGAGRVSVKATTTEKLGFTGRGEGIAAQAVATLRFPL